MAKIFLICTKSSSLLSSSIPDKLQTICTEIIPEIITPNPAQIIYKDSLAVAIANPVNSLSIREDAVCLGVMFGENEGWWKIGNEIPDGNFALYRFSNQVVEIATDDCASRNIWYYQDEEVFIASSSQRAIIQYLENFEPNEEAFPWMLSVGSLIFGMSWDKRIKPLAACTKLTFKIDDWSLSKKQFPLPFEATLPEKSKEAYQTDFLNAFDKSLAEIKLSPKDWVLPLSGGVDSRSLLISLSQSKRLSTVTWGDPFMALAEKSDAIIAGKLARKFNNPNQFIPIQKDKESLEIVIDRFIRYGEGMTDNLAGYLDGFHVWKQLFEEGYSGYIRGDRAISTREPKDADSVIADLEIRSLDFYENGKQLAKWLPKQILPKEMEYKKGEESWAFWRVRLLFHHYSPTIYAALRGCKSGFLETSNPLLNRTLFQNSLPLTDKIKSIYEIYKAYVLSKTPDIPVAEGNSNIDLKEILRSKDMVKMMREEFKRKSAMEVFRSELLSILEKPLKTHSEEIQNTKLKKNKKLKSLIKKITPDTFSEKRDKKKKYHLDPNMVAFRAFIVLRIIQQLKKDAELFKGEKLLEINSQA